MSKLALDSHDKVKERSTYNYEIKDVPWVAHVGSELPLFHCLIAYDETKCYNFDEGFHCEEDCEAVVNIRHEDSEGIVWIV